MPPEYRHECPMTVPLANRPDNWAAIEEPSVSAAPIVMTSRAMVWEQQDPAPPPPTGGTVVVHDAPQAGPLYKYTVNIPSLCWGQWDGYSALGANVSVGVDSPEHRIKITGDASGSGQVGKVEVTAKNASPFGPKRIAKLVATRIPNTVAFSSKVTYTDGSVVEFSPSYGPDGRLLTAAWSRQTSYVSGTAEIGQTALYEVNYAYGTSGAAQDQVVTATQRRNVSGAGWVDLYRAEYEYYGSGDANGAYGDLKRVTGKVYDGSAWHPVAANYVRSYPSTNGSGAYAHATKYVVGQEAYARMLRDGISDPTAASDSVLAQYADNYFTYNANGRVASETTGGCGSCAGTSVAIDTFAYATRPGYADYTDDNFNGWKWKTTVTHANGGRSHVYCNFRGDALLRVDEELNGATVTRAWHSYWHYDANGNLEYSTSGASVASVDPSQAELGVTLSSSAVKRKLTYDSASGNVASVALEVGGVSHLQEAYTYALGADGVYRVASSATSPDGSTQLVTSYAYTFDGMGLLRSRTTTLPAVSTANNGAGVQDAVVEMYDFGGNVVWAKDERGRITKQLWDPASGRVAQVIRDVDTDLVDEPSGWSTPDGLHLVSDYTYDTYGRLAEVLGPEVSVVTDAAAGTSATVRPATWTVYRNEDLAGAEQLAASGYQSGTSYTLVNPVSITKLGKADVLEEVEAVRGTTSGKLAASDSFAQGSYRRWSVSGYASNGLLTSQDVYHTIPGSGAGAEGSNYDRTRYGYDASGRRVRTVSPGGTVTRVVHDQRDRVVSEWVGTDDTPSSGTWSPTNTAGTDLVLLTENEYDGGLGGGNGNLTKETRHVDASTTRVTVHGYDARGRRVTSDGELNAFTKLDYDNMGRVVKREAYDGSLSGTLLSRGETRYDERGRVYQQVAYAVNNSGGVGNALTSNIWYDAGGNPIKSVEAGAGKTCTKLNYDGLGRVTRTYVGHDAAETSYADAASTAGDTVIEQSETTHDAAGNIVQSLIFQRRHDATGTGALSTASEPKARASYAAAWFDALGREVASVDYGTNGGAAFTRPGSVPAASDTVLVARTLYDDDGAGHRQIDAKGAERRVQSDAAGRTTKVIEAYDDGNPATGASDRDRTTEYAYTADGRVKTLKAVNAATGDQITTYVYGTTAAEGYPSTMLLRAVIYPDSDDAASNNGTSSVSVSNGADGVFDRVEMRYDRLGQVVERKDQNGTTHAYDHDALGRRTQDRVTAFGAGVDQAVKRVGRTYTTRGQLEKTTSYDHATVGSGAVVNEVQLAYNDFGQASHDYQGVDAAVNIATTPKTVYAYTDGSGSSNRARLTSVAYPIGGRTISYDYGTSGDTSDAINRLESVKDGATVLQAATYLGRGRVVRLLSSQPGLILDYTGGADYAASLDRFGRVVDHKWTTASGATTVDEFAYGYDRADLRRYREHANASSRSESYAYDALDRLVGRAKGTLNGTKTGVSGTPSSEEGWTLDALGNWGGYQTKAAGVVDLAQTRAHNKANEVGAISETTGASWVDPAHDRAGNMTTMPKPDAPTATLSATYDAWNRLKTATTGGVTWTYLYDGLGRRTRATPTSGDATTYYYSGWRVVGVQAGTSTTDTYVWGLRYVDELVCRDRAAGSTTTRHYAVQDANFNVTAVVDASGSVAERYGYTPYGLRSVLDASFGPLASSGIGWAAGHQGLLHEESSGLIYNRARYIHPGLGRFANRDPAEYADSASLYEYEGGEPTTAVDPTGLWKATGPINARQSRFLRASICVMSATGNLTPWEAGQMRSLLNRGRVMVGNEGGGKLKVFGQTLGDFRMKNSWVIINDRAIEDDIFGPSTFIHENTHYYSTENITWNILEKWGADAISLPAMRGNAIASSFAALSNLPSTTGTERNRLDELFCKCGLKSKCNNNRPKNKNAPNAATCPTSSPTSTSSQPSSGSGGTP